MKNANDVNNGSTHNSKKYFAAGAGVSRSSHARDTSSAVMNVIRSMLVYRGWSGGVSRLLRYLFVGSRANAVSTASHSPSGTKISHVGSGKFHVRKSVGSRRSKYTSPTRTAVFEGFSPGRA